MASRYWVGNGGTWDNEDTTHWSATSGGSGGASVPGPIDDIFFNSSSFTLPSQIVDIVSNATYAKSINFTGVTNSPHITFTTNYGYGYILLCGGDFTLVSAMTIDDNFVLQQASYPAGPLKVTSAGHRLGRLTMITEILDNLECYQLEVTNFVTNNYNINADILQFDGLPGGATVTIGSSVITISPVLNAPTGTIWDTGWPGLFIIWSPSPGYSININWGSSTVNLPAQSSFQHGWGETNIRIEGNASGQVTFSGTTSRIICPSGTIIAKYTTITESHASGGAGFYYSPLEGCVNGGGNTGWNFMRPLVVDPPVIPPIIPTDPPATPPSSYTFPVSVTGTGFTGVTSVTGSAGVTINSYTVVSDTLITVYITVPSSAVTHTYEVTVYFTITVTNPGSPGGSSSQEVFFEWNEDWTAYSEALLKVDPRILGHVNVSDNSYPKYWYQWGDKIIIEPVPDDEYPLVLYLSDYPHDPMVLNSDTPVELPDEFHSCVVDFALWVLALKLKRWRQAAGYYNIYIRNLKIRQAAYMKRKAEQRAIHSIPDNVKGNTLRKEVDTRAVHQIPANVKYAGGETWAH